MAGLNSRPHAFKDTLGAVQFALIETRLEQLHLRTLSLGDHSELKANLFAGYQTTYQIAVQQQLLGLILSLVLIPSRPGRLEVLHHDRIIGLQ